MINQADWRKIAKTVPHTTPRFLDPDAPNDVTMLSGTCLVWREPDRRYHVAEYCVDMNGKAFWVHDSGDMSVDAEDLWIPLPRVAIYCRR